MTDAWASPDADPVGDVLAAVKRARKPRPWVRCSVCGRVVAGARRIWGTGGWYVDAHASGSRDLVRCLGDTRTDHTPVTSA